MHNMKKNAWVKHHLSQTAPTPMAPEKRSACSLNLKKYTSA